MKTLSIILIALLCLSAKNYQTTSEQLIYKGKFVEVYVEKEIYHTPTYENFLMKYTIKNTSDKIIGVDLSDYWKVIYPNQWGIYKTPYREVIDERQIIPDKVFDKEALISKYKNNKLTFIKPKKTIEYYRDWNGSGEKIELINKDEYLIISVDGQLLLTDGNEVEHITLTNAKETERVVVFEYPIINKSVPENATIIIKN
jgi:hypothetical protein